MQEREIKLRVITAALPRSIHGVSAKDGDTFIVLINETDTPERQQQAFLHEARHIWRRDHDREGADVGQIETKTRRDIEQLEAQT